MMAVLFHGFKRDLVVLIAELSRKNDGFISKRIFIT
jgi:hypothetical protein